MGQVFKVESLLFGSGGWVAKPVCAQKWSVLSCWMPKPYSDVVVNREVATLPSGLRAGLVHSAYSHLS